MWQSHSVLPEERFLLDGFQEIPGASAELLDERELSKGGYFVSEGGAGVDNLVLRVACFFRNLEGLEGGIKVARDEFVGKHGLSGRLSDGVEFRRAWEKAEGIPVAGHVELAMLRVVGSPTGGKIAIGTALPVLGWRSAAMLALSVRAA